jgi:hypothetical protein
MITHYGLRWEADEVSWGGRGEDPEEMLGTTQPQPLGSYGDDVSAAQTGRNFGNFSGIYCLYGGGMLEYCGATGPGTTLLEGLRMHWQKTLQGRWWTFSWFGYDPRDAADARRGALLELAGFAEAHGIPDLISRPEIPGAIEVRQVAHPESNYMAPARIAAILDELIAIYEAKVAEKERSP